MPSTPSQPGCGWRVTPATGAAAGSILGSLTPGAAPLRLPAPARSFPSRITIEAG